MDEIRSAVEKYNAFGYRLFMDTPVFRRVLALRNRAFRKKLLLVNLRDSAINAHMERAFVRAVSAEKTCALDVFHSFAHNYAFAGTGNASGFRIKYSGMDNLRSFAGLTEYSAVIVLDLPYRDEELPAWLWFAFRAGGEKHFIANDNLMAPGSIFAMDMAERLKALSAFDTATVVDQHDFAQWGRFGAPGRFINRPLAVDCEYYSPRTGKPGNYILSFGRADRDYAPLFDAAKDFPRGLKLKVFTDLPVKVPPGLSGRAEVLFCPPAPDRMRELLAGAALVVLPVRTTPPNPGAGLLSSLLSMAMGKITVTRGNPVVAGYLSDGRDSFLYKALTPAAISACVRRALAAGPAAARIRRAARETALSRFDMNSFAANFVKARLRPRRGGASARPPVPGARR